MTSARSVAELGRLGTATVYEASGIECALDPAIRPVWPGARIAGRAFTVRCAALDNLPIHLALERLSSGDVLVIAAGGSSGGFIGEIIATAARARGCAGAVIDGGVRDVALLEALAFPVFARTIALRRTVKIDQGEVGTSVDIGGVHVMTGDLVLGDTDGVIALAADGLDRVLEDALARETRERDHLRRIANGELTLDIYGWRK